MSLKRYLKEFEGVGRNPGPHQMGGEQQFHWHYRGRMKFVGSGTDIWRTWHQPVLTDSGSFFFYSGSAFLAICYRSAAGVICFRQRKRSCCFRWYSRGDLLRQLCYLLPLAFRQHIEFTPLAIWLHIIFLIMGECVEAGGRCFWLNHWILC